MKAKVLITGAAGFVGRALCHELLAAGYGVRAVVRGRSLKIPGAENALEVVQVPGIGRIADWGEMVRGVDYVAHLAAHVHQMRPSGQIDHEAYARINTGATERLAKAAAGRVKRMVYLSTVKVHGEATPPDRPFRESDAPNPMDDYAVSKWEAEQALRRLADTHGLEYCVLRPPLVYGPRVGANFLRLMRLVNKGLPIPLGAVNNKRSMVYVGNLVAAVMVCLEHPAAAGGTYLVSDGEDVSTAELLRRVAGAMGRRVRLLPVPGVLLRATAKTTGKSAEVDRLLDSLVLDSGLMRRQLAWNPPFTMDQGLKDTATWFAGLGS